MQTLRVRPTLFKLRNVALLVPVGQGAHSPPPPRPSVPADASQSSRYTYPRHARTTSETRRPTCLAAPSLLCETRTPAPANSGKRESPNLTCADAAYSNSHRPLTASVSFGAEHLRAMHVAIVHVYTVHVLQCIINRDVTSFSRLVASLCSGVPLGLGHFHPQAALPHARQHLEMQRDHTRGVSRTSAYSVKCALGIIFSFPFWPSARAHSGGTRTSGGCAERSSSMCEKFCRRRMRKNDISLYAN